jgi:2-polyprenyl-6-methoxyphenol hydroxylase-like FAD-dependent oxidoreductase
MGEGSHPNGSVLVVGGGPVGLTMACELLRHGVDCRIVDQNAAPQPWSKAAAVSARTMEVWQDMGIVERALERGRPVFGVNLHRGLERFAQVSIHVEGTPFPYIFGMAQRETELMLAKRLDELGGRFEREVKLAGFSQDDDGVSATLVHRDGREEQMRTPWLVGCDGAHSTVRQGLDLPFEGSTFEETIVQGDLKVDFPFAADPNEAQVFVSPAGPIGMIPLLDEGRYRVLVLGIADPPDEPPLEMLQQIVGQRCPEGVHVYDPAWTVSFRFHGRIVPRYRSGSVFLAGDAAHIHSPAGGQGMNMGIQDAYNLAWKLALVQRGVCSEEILDSYDLERRPVGQRTVDVTDAATKRAMRMMTLRSPLAQSLRNQAMSFILNAGILQGRAFRSIGQLSVSYAASPIVGDHHRSVWRSELIGTRADERPTTADWIKFTNGPGAGERVPDLDLADGRTLFEVMRGTKHVLLLFDGAAASEEGYRNLSAIGDRVTRRYGEHVGVRVVVPFDRKPDALDWDGDVLLDEDGAVHEHFGCGSEALYLIRPDGYVGYRSQPAAQDELFRYLETIFVV